MKILASSPTGKVEEEKDKDASLQQHQHLNNHDHQCCNDDGCHDNYSCPCKLVNGNNQPSIIEMPSFPRSGPINNLTNGKSRKEKWSSINLNSPPGHNNRGIESLSTMSDDLYYKYIRLSLILITFLAATGIILITLGYLFFNYYHDDGINHVNFPWTKNNEVEHVYFADFIDTSGSDYHDYTTPEYSN